MRPPAIEPDTKDWTVTITDGCSECGFDPTYDVTRTGDRIRATLPRYQAALARDDAGKRRDPHTWSPLEYACHVRDVFRTFTERLGLMLREEDPLFANWDQDATAVVDRYWAQSPRQVSDATYQAGQETAALFDAVPDEAWGRTGRRSNGSTFTVRTLAIYCLHDVEHHLHDVGA